LDHFYLFFIAEFYGEGPVTGGVAGKWWLESIKQYGGRENILPMDGHGVLGMIAPRACALANAWFDEAGEWRPSPHC
jgi:hypothetical protein